MLSASSVVVLHLQICCEELQTVMVPLPDCASGEWGPTKATRLFGLIPITHQVSKGGLTGVGGQPEERERFILTRGASIGTYCNLSFSIFLQDPLIFAGRSLDLQFRMSRPLTDFMATLHKNGIEEKKLAKYVTHSTLDDIVTFIIK